VTLGRRALPGAVLAAALAFPTAARGAVVSPGTSAGPSATCQENFPSGSERPKLSESFPDRGKTGYALTLEVVVEHGKGETVLPSGLGAKSGGDDTRALESAGFFLPDPSGGSAPTLEKREAGERAKSTLRIPFVVLPKKPGRTELELPPLPIAMARASGEVRTLCTKPHRVILEDPIANTPDAKPKANPKPLRQREEWTAAKHATYGALAALAVGALAAFLVRLWRRRPKPVPPPPPPRPPWEVALEELFDVRIAELVQQGRYAEHYDRVSDAVRRYLGARYGFEGLETTTHEALAALRRVLPRISVLPQIESFLDKADLVKFAKLAPTESECHAALAEAEDIVRRTMPPMIAANVASFEAAAPRAPSPPAPGGPPP
jgi:hypothetical protein